jgi:putative alpha-1,2-mannosidase
MTRPLFASAKIHFENGKTLSIRSSSRTKGEVIVSFNGKRLRSPMMEHAALLTGGELLFE